jgi:hypothetical protein
MSLFNNYNDLPWQNQSDIVNLSLKNSHPISNLVNSCSTFTTNEGTCSGSFITLSNNDLKYGMFMTAAHCVMDNINGGIDQNLKDVYVTNPLTGNFVPIDINNIYYAGLADIAIIRTDIDLSGTDIALHLANELPTYGDECYMCGNPSGVDTRSISKGVVRDPNYFFPSGSQVPPTLFVDTPAFGGNSGSPIVNKYCKIIGILTFGYVGNETLNGGSNLSVLQNQLPELFKLAMTNSNTKQSQTQLYIGISYTAINNSPESFVSYYTPNLIPNQGAKITTNRVNSDSPFKGIVNDSTLLLSANVDGTDFDFGVLPDQNPPGMMVYTGVKNITVKHITPITYVFEYRDFSDSGLINNWENNSKDPWDSENSRLPNYFYSYYTWTGSVENHILTSKFFIELSQYNVPYNLSFYLTKLWSTPYGDIVDINIIYENGTTVTLKKLTDSDITTQEKQFIIPFTPTGKFKFQINHMEDNGNIIYFGKFLSVSLSTFDNTIKTSQVTLTSPIPVDKDLPLSGNSLKKHKQKLLEMESGNSLKKHKQKLLEMEKEKKNKHHKQ